MSTYKPQVGDGDESHEPKMAVLCLGKILELDTVISLNSVLPIPTPEITFKHVSRRSQIALPIPKEIFQARRMRMFYGLFLNGSSLKWIDDS